MSVKATSCTDNIKQCPWTVIYKEQWTPHKCNQCNRAVVTVTTQSRCFSYKTVSSRYGYGRKKRAGLGNYSLGLKYAAQAALFKQPRGVIIKVSLMRWRQLVTVSCFLLVWVSTLDAYHCPGLSRDALQCLRKLLPNQSEVEESLCAILCSSFYEESWSSTDQIAMLHSLLFKGL